MGYFSFGSQAVLAWRILLYCAAWMFGGAALIGLSVYLVLLGSEVLFSECRNKTMPGKSRRANHKVATIESDPSASGYTLCYGQSKSPSQMMRSARTLLEIWRNGNAKDGSQS